MSNVEIIKSNLIDKILSLNNEDLLKAIDRIIGELPATKGQVTLSPQQKEVLMMSDDDIKRGRLFSEEEIDKLDQEHI